jgi:hypothetical protein
MTSEIIEIGSAEMGIARMSRRGPVRVRVMDFLLWRHFSSLAVTESTSRQNGRCEDLSVRISHLVMASVALYAVWQIVSSRPIERPPGAIAAADPLQSDLEAPQTITKGEFQVIGQARFSAEVRVLSRERYRLGALADVAPLDIAVGWGPMSDSKVLEYIDITQSGRFYFWHYDDEPPIPQNEIESHSANWHLVPANSTVWHKLSGLRVGNIVKLDGMLVNLKNPDTGTFATSLRRDDTGAGACEIIYVQSASVR